ncbi:MAG: CocE/NonD family hydrolase [Candidatus Helarchaeota archaeon]
MDDDYPFISSNEFVKKPEYKGFITHSHYISMRDGVKIAFELYIPKKLPSNKKIPTVLVQTRYWRAYRYKIPFRWLIKDARIPVIVKGLTSYGFAVMWVDVRGTGASFGTRSYPFSDEEIEDTREIIDWIVRQSWSDGNVVTYGNSYSGTMSELTASLCHPAVKGILTKHNPWDFYLHAVFPGGCFNEKFMQYWSDLGRALDMTEGKGLVALKPFDPKMARLATLAVKSVKPVEKDKNFSSLKKVAQIHKENKHPIDYFGIVNNRDDPMNEEGMTVDKISTFSKKDKIEKLGVPFYCWGSWQDSTTANMIILRFINYSNPQKAVIGDWEHKQLHRASPFHSYKESAVPNQKEQIRDWVKFYNDCITNHFNSDKILYYYTMGEEKWKKTTVWPPLNQKMTRWYLSKNNILSKTRPETSEGADDYEVNYESTTGIRNRWYTLLSVPVIYPNREEKDSKLLCYTSDPLEEDIEITGHPIVTLFLKSTHEDGMLHVHFEFLDLNGKIHWVTDGQLRLIHRKISSEKPPYKNIPGVPYHSFKKKDVQPLIPGETAEIKFALYPTSIVLRRGFKIRIAIGGADKDTFGRYPEDGTPIITIERNNVNTSYIDIPIIKKD